MFPTSSHAPVSSPCMGRQGHPHPAQAVIDNADDGYTGKKSRRDRRQPSVDRARRIIALRGAPRSRSTKTSRAVSASIFRDMKSRPRPPRRERVREWRVDPRGQAAGFDCIDRPGNLRDCRILAGRNTATAGLARTIGEMICADAPRIIFALANSSPGSLVEIRYSVTSPVEAACSTTGGDPPASADSCPSPPSAGARRFAPRQHHAPARLLLEPALAHETRYHR